jgi:hypothetical protein
VGAWGHGAFENDDAADWVYELVSAADLEFVREALRSVAGSANYVEVPEGCIGLAAAEVIASACESPSTSTPPAVSQWLAGHSDSLHEGDRSLAIAAVDRVLAQDSELAELWQDADGSTPTWLNGVRDLRARLGAPEL